MKNYPKKVLAFIGASMLIACGPAQIQAPAAGVTAASIDAETRRRDFHVPVITMEQIYGGNRTLLQGYRVQIFKDASAIYHGISGVETFGEIQFHIKPEQVQKILAEFARLKFWRVPEEQFDRTGQEPMMRMFTLRDGSTTRTVRLSEHTYGAVLQKVIEDEVQSDRWRCPYVNDRNIELCAAVDNDARISIPIFLERDLPKLLEAYK